MNDLDPTSPDETLPTGPISSTTSEPSVERGAGGAHAVPPPPPVSTPVGSASVSMTKVALRQRVRRSVASRKGRWVAAAVVLCGVVGLSVDLTSSPSATTTSSSATTQPRLGGGSVGGPTSGGGRSNARSGPASGGAAGTVGGVSTSSFTMTTATGQRVTVDETPSTEYQRGTSSISASTVTNGDPVLVLGITSGTTITATQVNVRSTGGGSSTSSAAAVIPFQRGAPTTSRQVGQIPASFSQGSGTIVSGTAANTATEAALGAYPGGVVDRVVKLSNGEYNVHIIGVNWPHHVFVNQDFQVVGAE
jgi:hypothetical protein